MHWTLTPILRTLTGALASVTPTLEEVASRHWEIAPSEIRSGPPAYLLPGQFDRVIRPSPVSGTLDDERKLLNGSKDGVQGATRALLLKDVLLADGVLYKGSARAHLHKRTRLPVALRTTEESRPAALYCSFAGNRYFGNWLIDDCTTYSLATEHGIPITTRSLTPSPQMLQYEALLGMRPERCDQVWFRQLVVFQDLGQNRHKHLRFKRLGDKLLQGRQWSEHPGVFILRGSSGQRRVLQNELEIAERLHRRRGFRVIDPTTLTASEVVDACAGARAVVGVEGSQLVHGLLPLQPGGSLLTLQPPDRYCSLLKDLTDRDGQKFGIVVGLPAGDSFTIPPDEVEQTLDLMEQSKA